MAPMNVLLQLRKGAGDTVTPSASATPFRVFNSVAGTQESSRKPKTIQVGSVASAQAIASVLQKVQPGGDV